MLLLLLWTFGQILCLSNKAAVHLRPVLNVQAEAISEV